MGVLATGIIFFTLYSLIMLAFWIFGLTGKEKQNEKA